MAKDGNKGDILKILTQKIAGPGVRICLICPNFILDEKCLQCDYGGD